MIQSSGIFGLRRQVTRGEGGNYVQRAAQIVRLRYGVLSLGLLSPGHPVLGLDDELRAVRSGTGGAGTYLVITKDFDNLGPGVITRPVIQLHPLVKPKRRVHQLGAGSEELVVEMLENRVRSI